jgi:SAM-dependent methyltransferase
MSGDFAARVEEFEQFLLSQLLLPKLSARAIDLGAGHGIQTKALLHLGFQVTAIDFSPQLLKELSENTDGFEVEIAEDDILSIRNYSGREPELIVCCGDTLTHLNTMTEAERFISDCCRTLVPGGKLVLSFRDYSIPLAGNDRFIPVKSDENRILTCFLEYSEFTVRVTDIVYERTPDGWQQKISSYEKLRLTPDSVTRWLEGHAMKIAFAEPVNHQYTIIAER